MIINFDKIEQTNSYSRFALWEFFPDIEFSKGNRARMKRYKK